MTATMAPAFTLPEAQRTDSYAPRVRQITAIEEAQSNAFPSLATPPLTIRGQDGKVRPAWVGDDPIMIDYYDSEWGTPLRDEEDLFQTLSLLTFQAGLRWRTVLARRTALRGAFAGFAPDLLAIWNQDDIERLMEDSTIIRNRRKIEAVLANARATIKIRPSGGLPKLVWDHQPDFTPVPVEYGDVPDSTPESVALAKALREHGFTAVGPKTCFALMQAAGVVDANPVEAYRRGESGMWESDGSRRTYGARCA